MRVFINFFLQIYLYKNIFNATIVFNFDGGKNVIFAYQESGQPLKLFAQGFRKKEQIPGLKPFFAKTLRIFLIIIKIEFGGRANLLGKIMRRSGFPFNPAKYCG
ncbi:hypothetical protein PoMZ_08665 [Pyricularia oryzae]|uniref:Uncharacterized protein n=1 Tax=Pyricularia oryzae TaxID=318829 RepID=A0A4P7NI78_PYROR|nr:hypothetical protein PoMZ_08665 [Pyricularia oryzae]